MKKIIGAKLTFALQLSLPVQRTARDDYKDMSNSKIVKLFCSLPNSPLAVCLMNRSSSRPFSKPYCI